LLGGRKVPVFDELELLLPSEFGTFAVTIENASEQELEAFAESIIQHGLNGENWETDVRVICRACSEGRPFDEAHDHAEEQPLAPASNFCLAIAATSEAQVNEILVAWQAG